MLGWLGGVFLVGCCIGVGVEWVLIDGLVGNGVFRGFCFGFCLIFGFCILVRVVGVIVFWCSCGEGRKGFWGLVWCGWWNIEGDVLFLGRGIICGGIGFVFCIFVVGNWFWYIIGVFWKFDFVGVICCSIGLMIIDGGWIRLYGFYVGYMW